MSGPGPAETREDASNDAATHLTASPSAATSQARRAADTLRLVGRVAALSLHRPRRPDQRWDAFWRGVTQGSLREPIIWDAAPGVRNDEIRHHLHTMAAMMDTSLPVVDLGCGNGAISHGLTGTFPSVLGVDVSLEAVAAANAVHAHVPNLSFRPLDATQPAAAALGAYS